MFCFFCVFYSTYPNPNTDSFSKDIVILEELKYQGQRYKRRNSSTANVEKQHKDQSMMLKYIKTQVLSLHISTVYSIVIVKIVVRVAYL